MFDIVLSTPIGNLGLKCHCAKLTLVQFLDNNIFPLPNRQFLSAKIHAVVDRIESFFVEPAPLSDLPHRLLGTPFQLRVWQMIRKIPLGEVQTYGELAKKLGTSARAIGMACRKNPLPLVIPCHRVVAAKDLGGFCGETKGNKLAIKAWLLAHERGTC